MREQNIKNELFIPESQCHLYCFIPLSLGVKHEFKYLKTNQLIFWLLQVLASSKL